MTAHVEDLADLRPTRADDLPIKSDPRDESIRHTDIVIAAPETPGLLMLDPKLILVCLLTDATPLRSGRDVDAVRKVTADLRSLADAVRWWPLSPVVISARLEGAGTDLHQVWPKHRFGYVCASQATMVRVGMLDAGVVLAERLEFLAESIEDALDLAVSPA